MLRFSLQGMWFESHIESIRLSMCRLYRLVISTLITNFWGMTLSKSISIVLEHASRLPIAIERAGWWRRQSSVRSGLVMERCKVSPTCESRSWSWWIVIVPIVRYATWIPHRSPCFRCVIYIELCYPTSTSRFWDMDFRSVLDLRRAISQKLVVEFGKPKSI